MAIQHTIEEGASQYGISFNDAYYRVATCSIQRQNGELKFVVMIDLPAYATASPTENTREVDFKRYIADLDEVEAMVADSFTGKCYLWVMSQPDMVGSTPV